MGFWFSEYFVIKVYTEVWNKSALIKNPMIPYTQTGITTQLRSHDSDLTSALGFLTKLQVLQASLQDFSVCT